MENELRDEIRQQIIELKDMEPGSEDRKTAAETINLLVSANDKLQSEKKSKKDFILSAMGVVAQVLGIFVPAAVYTLWMGRAMRIETEGDGYLKYSVSKSFMNKLKP